MPTPSSTLFACIGCGQEEEERVGAGEACRRFTRST